MTHCFIIKFCIANSWNNNNITCLKDSNSVCFDEIRFLGDYYPKKLENDNRELNRLYYGY